MTRDDFDIFINAGPQHMDALMRLLPKLRPFGRVHVGSCFLEPRDLGRVRPHCDFLHQPAHHPKPYQNHCLFCTREYDTLASGRWLIKTDADTDLRDDYQNSSASIASTHSAPNPIASSVIRRFCDTWSG